MVALPPDYMIAANVSAALAEDVGVCDWTAQMLPAAAQGRASVRVREPAVLCGRAWFDEAFRQVDATCQIHWLVEEGAQLPADTVVCEITGPARSLLTAERTALNFLQLLSGVATVTQHYAEAVKGTAAQVLDTRKTIPGLRRAQKYAVKVGGGANQRIGLYDGILIKENHIMAAGGITAAVALARQTAPASIPIQVEVETLEQLAEALACKVTSVLLDNMSLADMRTAVVQAQGLAVLEASGGIDFSTLRAVAETGVQRISTGKLTKDIQAVDFSMRFAMAN